MRKILLALTLLFATCSVCETFAQNVKNKKQTQQQQEKKQETDIYKEFSLTSFSDEEPLKEIDSSKLSYHLIGIKGGYSINTVGYSTDVERKSVKSPQNFGIYYTYYHSLWNRMPYFGFQFGVEYNEVGFVKVDKPHEGPQDGPQEGPQESKSPAIEKEYAFKAIEVPLLTQFRVDFWKMRVMLGLGPYGYFIVSGDDSSSSDPHFSPNKAGIGIMGGGGVAFMMKRFELHLDCYYKYALSHFYDPKIYSEEFWTYTHLNQLSINLGLFFRIGGGKKWKK